MNKDWKSTLFLRKKRARSVQNPNDSYASGTKAYLKGTKPRGNVRSGTGSHQPLLPVGVEVDGVFVVVLAVEDDDDVAVVFRAVEPGCAVLGFRLVEFGDLDRAGVSFPEKS